MSGIVGIWNLDNKPVDRDLLIRMSAILAHRGPDSEQFWIQGSVGLACQLLKVTPEAANEIQPLVHSSGAVLVFDGRLDNREELLAILNTSPEISMASPDPALVLAAYEVFGDRLPEKLAGEFALGLFDPNRRQLLLTRDAIGIRPLYYCRMGETFIFASEIKALLVHPLVITRPNDEVLAGIVLGGGSRRDQSLTCFENVFSLPPAFTAILTRREFVTRQYWDFDPTRQTRYKSFGEYVEEFREHFERAVRRRMRSTYPIAVSVSGGLDSSSIFCTAEALRRRESGQHPQVVGLSYLAAEGSPADEQVFLREIEREYSVLMERLPAEQTGFFTGARDEVWHTEIPLLDSQWQTTSKLFCAIRASGARVLLTGHWGDQMIFDQGYLIDLFNRLHWGEVWAHLQEYPRWCPDADHKLFRRFFLLNLIKEHVPIGLVPMLRWLRGGPSRARPDRSGYTKEFRGSRCHSSLRQPPGGKVRATAHARSLYREARSQYFVMCMEWNNQVAAMHGLEQSFPFLDRDLIAYLMSIPGEMQTLCGRPKALLREALRGVLPSSIVERRGKADFTSMVSDGAGRDYPQVLRYFEDGSLAARSGYIQADVLRQQFLRLRHNLSGHDYRPAVSLRNIFGLELWLRVFFETQPIKKENS